MRVLTVCLGNICRSPTAEAAIHSAAADVGLTIDVDSAGTSDWHIGELPDARMREAASDVGLSLDSRARQFEVQDLEAFDLVLAMDAANLRDIRAVGADATHRARVELFRHWDPRATSSAADVPDPYYGGEAGFHDVVAMCQRTAVALVAELAAAQPNA